MVTDSKKPVTAPIQHSQKDIRLRQLIFAKANFMMAHVYVHPRKRMVD